MKSLLVLLVFVACCHSQDGMLQQCPGSNFTELSRRVTASPCGHSKTHCRLKKGTDVTVTMMFTPESEVHDLTNEVLATVGDVAIPFPGVHGSSACASVFHAEDGAPAACPLPPSKHYVYSFTFPVLPFYPTGALRVHWALKDGDKKVFCFEVPAAIVD